MRKEKEGGKKASEISETTFNSFIAQKLYNARLNAEKSFAIDNGFTHKKIGSIYGLSIVIIPNKDINGNILPSSTVVKSAETGNTYYETASRSYNAFLFSLSAKVEMLLDGELENKTTSIVTGKQIGRAHV